MDIEKINLLEEELVKWYAKLEAKNTRRANGVNEIADDVFKRALFNSIIQQSRF